MKKLVCFAMLICMHALAQGEPTPAESVFQRIKSLEGRWLSVGKGGSNKNSKAREVTLEYSVKSNGSIVVESFEDMLTVYHVDQDKLMATHYCSAGNQPRLVAELGNLETNTIHFRFKDITNLRDSGDGHISALKMDMTGADTLTQSWTWKVQNTSEEMTFSFERDPSDYRIELQDFGGQTTLVQEDSGSLANIGEKIGGVLGGVSRRLKDGNVKPLGAPFVRYFKFSEDEIKFEGGFPIAKDSIGGDGTIRVSGLSAGKVAFTTHRGSQKGIGKAYEALHRWIAKSQFEEGGAPWEVYIDDPSSAPEEKLRTLVYYPVQKRSEKKMHHRH